jgi:rfaE bifunctional protein nucleotidyltransferase chain/domain
MPREVILVTGVFDILHEEHSNFLQKAKALGGRLIVGVESDVRVRQIKGSTRPINPQSLRVENIEKLGIADTVFVLPEEFSKPEHHRQLLSKIRPTILAVSANTPHLESKQQLMQEIGGRVVIVHQHNPAISTTQIIAKYATQEARQ